jgi:simple sugar transport system ATP-binding protein
LWLQGQGGAEAFSALAVFFEGGEMSADDIIVRVSGVDVSFPGVHALNGVDFSLRQGEIHALMGENGAGKSTLVKVLTGIYRKDKGRILLDGAEFEPRNPLEAQERGVNAVHQDIHLCNNLSVAENIFVGRQKTRFGRIDWKSIRSGAENALARLGLTLDVNRPLGCYSVAVRQMVAIARAVDIDSKVLILDEPTSSLDRVEVECLFSVMRSLRDEGVSIIFISHCLDQVYEICERATVLRNGRLIGEYELRDLSRADLISKMIGKGYSYLMECKRNGGNNSSNKQNSKVFAEAKGLGKRGVVEPFDLTLKKGEVVGFAGLLGSGRTEAATLFFGIEGADGGELLIGKKKQAFRQPHDAVRHLIAFCPEDCKQSGIIGSLSVRKNIILAMQAKQGIFKYIPFKRQAEIADAYIKILGIAATGREMPAGNLSGGNQQKVILARWLVTNPALLILDEPTRGIDAAAKARIMNLALKLCDEGMSIMFISSELEEVIRYSDRIVAMRGRKKIAEFPGGVDQAEILGAIGRRGG